MVKVNEFAIEGINDIYLAAQPDGFSELGKMLPILFSSCYYSVTAGRNRYWIAHYFSLNFCVFGYYWTRVFVKLC